ncbi:hypothetical protein EV182_006913 [Spiromyces aspiralis]|uniref:Uncharacterized protein n=1 Tax=Spiromyces aspiralis TaxID=68401 RepID=A0ACC1HKK2_9FUNG|nr:hypothetical protein EV182_006913 [Spiromyces aspiralis]
MALGTEEASQEPFPDKDKALYEQIKPRLFFVGPPKSGKTSILQVLFYDMHATETLYLQPTAAVTGYHMSVGIDIYDYPGNNGVDGGILLPDPNYYYSSRCAVVFVIDAQDDVLHQTSYLMEAAYQAYSAHIGIKFFVFLHKIDGLSEELKQGTWSFYSDW